MNNSDKMASPIGIGLIGLGRHGLRYAKHLVEDLPAARLVAVCRLHAGRGVPLDVQHPVACYSDFRDLIDDPAVQAVMVVTPPSLALSICREAVRARKPLLMEKPLAPTAREAREIVQVTTAAAVPLMTAHTLRYESVLLALKTRLHEAGPPHRFLTTINIESRPRAPDDPSHYGGRGILLEVGIHALDMVRFLTAQEVVEVRCQMDRNPSEGPENRATVDLHTSGGLACRIEVSRGGSQRIGRVEWIGQYGRLLADWTHHQLKSITPEGVVTDWRVEARLTLVPTIQGFLEALLHGQQMPVTGVDGQRAVEIAEACYQSAHSGGRPVVVLQQ